MNGLVSLFATVLYSYPPQPLNTFKKNNKVTCDVPMPPAKLGYRSSVKRGSGSSLQRLDVRRDARHSVDSDLLHPSSLDLLHTLSHNEGNLGALSPGE
uniref:Uncharacterized protein n=1 Tax=Scophthalmus maximus TaxID=52904 RepID=A0A8D3DK48_SCOMX